jgi:hypothetical protein
MQKQTLGSSRSLSKCKSHQPAEAEEDPQYCNPALPLFSCRVGRSVVLQCLLVGCFLQAGFLPPSIIGRGSLRVPLEVGNATRQPSMGGADPILTAREGETMRCDVMMHFLWPLHICTVLSGCPLSLPAWIGHGNPLCTSSCFIT